MTFLAAGFLTGLLALALPWWLHRLESRSPRTRRVSSVLLMRPADMPRQRHRTLRHRVLLGVRMLLLVLLALAFAQPLFERVLPDAGDGADSRPVLLVLDTSLSMTGSMAPARRQARRLLDALPAAVPAGVVAAASELTLLQTLTTDRARLDGAIAAAAADATRLDFDGLLGRLTALAASVTEEPVALHLISDFQASAMPDRFNALVADGEIAVTLHPVLARADNWQLSAELSEGGLRLVVHSHAAEARTVSIVVEDALGGRERRTLDVGPGARAGFTLPLPDAAGAPRWIRAALEDADAVPADDGFFVVVPSRSALGLPVFAGAGAATQVEYLRAAVAAAAPMFQPGPPTLSGPVAAVLDAGGLSAADSRRLERHLAEGGGVFMTVGPGTQRLGALPLSGATLTGRTLEADAAGLRVVTVDPRHPALAAGAADWRDVRVYRHLAVAPAAATALVALDDATGLLVEYPVAAGRVLALTTALDPRWSSLVTSPAFVELVDGALRYLAQENVPVAATAGEPLVIPASNAQLFDGSGARMLSLGDTAARTRVRLNRPGFYTLRTPNRERLLAVNPDPRESLPAAAEPGLLARWQAALRAGDHSAAADTASVDTTAADTASAPLALAPWLLVLLLMLAVLEPAAANAGRSIRT